MARFIFSQQAPWVTGLMKLRDLLVSAFGLKTARQSLQEAVAGWRESQERPFSPQRANVSGYGYSANNLDAVDLAIGPPAR